MLPVQTSFRNAIAQSPSPSPRTHKPATVIRLFQSLNSLHVSTAGRGYEHRRILRLCGGPVNDRLEKRHTRIAGAREGTPIKLKAGKGTKQQRQERCKARTKAGGPCHAPAVEAGLCFCHAHPERLAELGRQGGQKNGRRSLDERSIPDRPLKSMGDVGELLEETINRVRQGPFDIRAANAMDSWLVCS